MCVCARTHTCAHAQREGIGREWKGWEEGSCYFRTIFTYFICFVELETDYFCKTPSRKISPAVRKTGKWFLLIINNSSFNHQSCPVIKWCNQPTLWGPSFWEFLDRETELPGVTLQWSEFWCLFCSTQDSMDLLCKSCIHFSGSNIWPQILQMWFSLGKKGKVKRQQGRWSKGRSGDSQKKNWPRTSKRRIDLLSYHNDSKGHSSYIEIIEQGRARPNALD